MFPRFDNMQGYRDFYFIGFFVLFEKRQNIGIIRFEEKQERELALSNLKFHNHAIIRQTKMNFISSV